MELIAKVTHPDVVRGKLITPYHLQSGTWRLSRVGLPAKVGEVEKLAYDCLVHPGDYRTEAYRFQRSRDIGYAQHTAITLEMVLSTEHPITLQEGSWLKQRTYLDLPNTLKSPVNGQIRLWGSPYHSNGYSAELLVAALPGCESSTDNNKSLLRTRYLSDPLNFRAFPLSRSSFPKSFVKEDPTRLLVTASIFDRARLTIDPLSHTQETLVAHRESLLQRLEALKVEIDFVNEKLTDLSAEKIQERVKQAAEEIQRINSLPVDY